MRWDLRDGKHHAWDDGQQGRHPGKGYMPFRGVGVEVHQFTDFEDGLSQEKRSRVF